MIFCSQEFRMSQICSHISYKPFIQQPVKENKQPARGSNCELITYVALSALLLTAGVALVAIGGIIANPPMLSVGISLLGALILGGLKQAISYTARR